MWRGEEGGVENATEVWVQEHVDLTDFCYCGGIWEREKMTDSTHESGSVNTGKVEERGLWWSWRRP
jgi:hypothetical protein